MKCLPRSKSISVISSNFNHMISTWNWKLDLKRLRSWLKNGIKIIIGSTKNWGKNWYRNDCISISYCYRPWILSASYFIYRVLHLADFFEQVHQNCLSWSLSRLSYKDQGLKASIAYKRRQLDPLQVALDKLCCGNKAYQVGPIFSGGELNPFVRLNFTLFYDLCWSSVSFFLLYWLCFFPLIFSVFLWNSELPSQDAA